MFKTLLYQNPFLFFSHFNHVLTFKAMVSGKRNANNTPANTHSLWLVKICMGPTKSCGSYISINQRECVEKCVL